MATWAWADLSDEIQVCADGSTHPASFTLNRT